PSPTNNVCSDRHLRGGAGAARSTEDTVQRANSKSPVKQRWRLVRNLLGPGLVTGAADDDPSGIATYSQAGAQFGYGLLWTVFLQMFVPYHRYAPVLKWMTLVLFLYVATAFTVKISWGEALAAMVIPRPRLDRDYLLTVVAVLGTTISPYLFFWQASQEVEE